MAKGTLAVAALVATVAACGGNNQQSPTGSTGAGGAALVGVSPTPGASGVAVDAPITLGFSGAMAAGMEQYVDLHMGGLSAATVPMSCAWSGNSQSLTCRPNAPLLARTTYTIHVGGGMTSAGGATLDFSQGLAMGGQWIMGGMMTGTHAGMGWGMMGGGWRNGNGSYGMMFTFTTA